MTTIERPEGLRRLREYLPGLGGLRNLPSFLAFPSFPAFPVLSDRLRDALRELREVGELSGSGGFREMFAPDPDRPRPTRRQYLADALIALALTAVAVAAAARKTVEKGIPVLPPGVPSAWAGSGAAGAAPVPPPPAAPYFHYVSVPAGPRDLVLVGLSALPLALRRRYPLTALWGCLIALLSDLPFAGPASLPIIGLAAYSAVRYSRNQAVAAGSCLLGAVLVYRYLGEVADAPEPLRTGLAVLLLLGAAAALVRGGRLRLRESRRRLDDLRRKQAEATRRAVAEERSRIAGELHDVVTHNVSVMVIQAGAARKVLDAQPELAKEALLAVENGGRAAMAELRHVMGLLAASGAAAPSAGAADTPADGLEPQPGLDQLEGLVARVRAAGLPVRLSVDLPTGPLPSGVELAAYRVVQEALTNALKHAAGAEAEVRVGHDDRLLSIEVTDSGGRRGEQAAAGNGRGLIGLRERLAVYGGTLESGGRMTGGFRILARVPWRNA
ncbi:sensor histidine kinase [Phaeacidiphilus oryzae]|uniref:sensor histidine kinase n=1 Tax=Phaeacidiphilus oryzae TaxID=348818 RepID=UPI000A4FFAC7|nr:histidine kinase [Phaeacidiphilus oryzae]